MYKAFGNKNTWTPKPVYVQLPSGVWTLASTHNVPSPERQHFQQRV